MPHLRRLLVPHDLSDYADEALAMAAELAGPTGDLLVLHAMMPFVPTAEVAIAIQVPVGEMMADAKRHLEGVVTRVIGSRGPKTTIKVLVGDPYRSIMDHTPNRDAIVMSTRGRTGLAHLLIGSVAEKTVRHSEIPVLTLRARTGRRVPKRRATGSRRRAA
jgi:universal stress protein A